MVISCLSGLDGLPNKYFRLYSGLSMLGHCLIRPRRLGPLIISGRPVLPPLRATQCQQEINAAADDSRKKKKISCISMEIEEITAGLRVHGLMAHELRPQ